MNLKMKGYLAGSVAAVTYGMNPLFTLPLYSRGMSPNSVLFFRYLCAIPVIWLMMRYRRQSASVNIRQLFMLALLGVIFALSSLALFESYRYMAVGIASTLLFIYPIIVALIMTLVFKERLTMTTILCIVMALAGIALLYKGEDGSTLNMTGTALVLVSALSYAFYIVFTNRSNVKRLSTLTVTFYVLLFGWMVFAVKACISGCVEPPSTVFMWSNILSLAILPTAISLLCTTVAIHKIGSTLTAILGALEPVTAVCLGVVVFREPFTMREMIGLTLIIMAVSMVVAGGRVDVLLNRVRKMFPKKK